MRECLVHDKEQVLAERVEVDLSETINGRTKQEGPALGSQEQKVSQEKSQENGISTPFISDSQVLLGDCLKYTLD